MGKRKNGNPGKTPSELASELGKLGAKKGGEARKNSLTPERRREIAQAAALAKWANQGKPAPAIAKYGAPDRPLKIGDIEITCYVLEDGRRVLAQRGIQYGIGMSTGGAGVGGERLAHLVRRLGAKGINVGDLVARLERPILFIPPHGGNAAYGYEATVLPDICKAILAARQVAALQAQQMHLAEQCEILLAGLGHVGIIALVDEATGYQAHRAHDALAQILERFIAKELRPWVKTFPTEFYREMFRLREWSYPAAGSTKRPMCAGLLTNEIVYRRLAPGVLDELQRITPRDEKGRLKYHLHRSLTEDIGHPKLREHLAVVVALMQISGTWDEFLHRLDLVRPKFGATLSFPFDPPPAKAA